MFLQKSDNDVVLFTKKQNKTKNVIFLCVRNKKEEDNSNGVVIFFFCVQYFKKKRRGQELTFSSCVAPLALLLSS
jgi:hypothetical protein